MNKFHFIATSLHKILIISLLLIICLIIGGFYYAQIWLKDIAVNSKSNSSQSTTSYGSTSQAQLQTELSSQKVAVDKAAGIVISSQDYQNKIKQDLDKYALDTGVTITDYGPTQPDSTGSIATPINGLQSNYVKVTIKNPIPYTNLIKFIKAIETNIPKMELTGISLSHSENSGDSVMVKPLIIEVYTK